MTPSGSCEGAGSAAATSTSAEAAGVASKSGSKGAGGGGMATTSAGGMKKGPWTAAEDAILMEYVRKHGEGNWNAVQKNSGLSRCGKSCRLRWANHLRPNLKKGPFSPDEERLILELHSKLGNKWARMAAQLPGRTDNEIKNYWNTRIKRRQRAGLPLYPPDIQHHAATSLHRRSPSTLTPASLSDHPKAAFNSTSIGATPLTLFDPINLSSPAPPLPSTTTPLLGLAHHSPFLASSSHRPKGFQDDDRGSFSLPFTTTTTTPTPAAPPPSQNPFFSFTALGSFDLSPHPPPPPHRHPPHHQQHQQHGFAVKMELPSSQFFPDPPRAIATGSGAPLGRSHCELLDALLRDTQTMGGGCGGNGEGGIDHDGGGHRYGDGMSPEPDVAVDMKWVKSDADGAGEGGGASLGLVPGTAGGEWDDSDHPTTNDTVTKRGAGEDAGCVDDDLSAFLDLIPMATAAPAAAAFRDWYNSDSGEASNGQSSGVTDENVGLGMQHRASSLSMAAEEDHSWSIGSCHWNDMPSSC